MLWLATLGAVVLACDGSVTVVPVVHDRDAAHSPAHPGIGRTDPEGGAAADLIRPQRASARPSPLTRYVVLGDYGWAGPAEQRVAEMVSALEPDYVFTTGDNNYPDGAAATIDQNIGQYFADFIFPYRGRFPSRGTTNRFFPALGNHDWDTGSTDPYRDYFTLPGNERYYDVVLGPVHYFAIDSDDREPDGIDATSAQARWLAATLRASSSSFNVVAMHHPPFSSGPHGDTLPLQWPYREWGVDLVLGGHDHGYERLEIANLTYVVCGLGGAVPYSFGKAEVGSLARYSAKHGVLLLEADAQTLRLSFINVDGDVIDSASIYAY